MLLPTTCLLTLATVAAVQPQGFDSPSIAAAIQQAAPGETVQLLAGTYELDEPIRLKSKIKFLGAGQDKTQVVYRGTKATVLLAFDGCEDVELAGITFDGRSNPLVHQGISGGNSRRLWLHNLTVRNLAAKTWGPHAILFCGHNPTMELGVTDSRITDCLIENIGVGAEYGGGIRLAWGSARNQIVGNTIRTTGRGGIFGDHSAELVIRNNRVSGSSGEGLGIEIWGGCPKSLIEDNVVDHWISVDQGHQSAVRRNVVGDDSTLKGFGIEIIASGVVVTDNLVKRGAHIGLSVSNIPVKNNVFWGYNTIRDSAQWGAQFQGETGGIAHHYFYRCVFENTVRNDPHAQYPHDSGHGFRTNDHCRGLVFEECAFRDNGGYGIQFGGSDVDAIDLVRSKVAGNGGPAVVGPARYTSIEFRQCDVQRNHPDTLPAAKPFSAPPPVVDFRCSETIWAGEPAQFECLSKSQGQITERLWDFSDGIAEISANPTHIFPEPGKYRVNLIAWDAADRGSRAEKVIEVLPAVP